MWRERSCCRPRALWRARVRGPCLALHSSLRGRTSSARTDLTRALEAWSFQGLHRVLIWVVLPCWIVTGRQRLVIGGSARHGDRADVLRKQFWVSKSSETQRTPEGATSLRLREAGRIGVQMRSPPRQSAGRIGQKPEVALQFCRDEPQQLIGRRAHAAADAGSRRADREQVYLSFAPDAYPVSSPPRPHHGPRLRRARCPDGCRCAIR
jgi:hypothetical protein